MAISTIDGGCGPTWATRTGNRAASRSELKHNQPGSMTHPAWRIWPDAPANCADEAMWDELALPPTWMQQGVERIIDSATPDGL